MTDGAARVFDAQAGDYDAARRRLVPSFDAFYAAAVGTLTRRGPAPRRVLDLGAGTGLLSARIAEAHPRAELVLLDAAPGMLARARARLGDRATYLEADLAGPLPQGPWDAVVSALAVHHLDDAGKRDLLSRVHAALAPNGVFVNADQVLAPTPALEAAYVRWHHAEATALGATADEWAASVERMALDRCASVEAQLAWLRTAGFADVDAPFRNHRFAVLAGYREATLTR